MLKSVFLGLAFSVSTVAAHAAPAPTQAAVGVGTEVVDTAGKPVGSVISMSGGYYVVRTDRHEARLPTASFTPHEGMLIFGLSREQLNAEVEKALAAAQAQVTKGAAVMGSGGVLAGTIEAVDAGFLTLRTPDGKLLRLPRSAVAPAPEGLRMAITTEELQRLAEAAGS